MERNWVKRTLIRKIRVTFFAAKGFCSGLCNQSGFSLNLRFNNVFLGTNHHNGSNSNGNSGGNVQEAWSQTNSCHT